MDWREHFTYDEANGNLTWKHRPKEAFKNKQAFGAWTRKYAGRIAGCLTRGYILVRIGNRLYRAHRIIWEMHHGPIPSGMVIDHVNKDRADNRLSNLRLATPLQNGANSKARKHNTTGLKGVMAACSSHNRVKKWRARIRHEGVTRYLGYFHTKEEAHCVYMAELEKLHGAFAS